MAKNPYVKSILISNRKINKGTKKAAKWVDDNYHDKKPILIAILKGAFPFYGNLITKIKSTIYLDFVVISSYKGALSAQTEPDFILKNVSDVKNRHIIFVEDVVDSGRTLSLAKKYYQKIGAKSIATISLIDKPGNRKVEYFVDFACFTVPDDKFIIGYGLDYKEELRNLPYIAEINKDMLK